MPYYIKKAKKTKETSKSSLSTLVRKLDKKFSLFIRLRDSRAFGHKAFRCISCGQIKPFAKADCGHYYSRKHMATRFDEDNAHSECSSCNRFSADHLIGYRENLIKKIGQQRFDMLTWKHNQTKHWSEFELKELIKYYDILIKKMQSE